MPPLSVSATRCCIINQGLTIEVNSNTCESQQCVKHCHAGTYCRGWTHDSKTLRPHLILPLCNARNQLTKTLWKVLEKDNLLHSFYIVYINNVYLSSILWVLGDYLIHPCYSVIDTRNTFTEVEFSSLEKFLVACCNR